MPLFARVLSRLTLPRDTFLLSFPNIYQNPGDLQAQTARFGTHAARLAGAFVKFLIELRGKERFLRAYSAVQNSSDPAAHQRNAAQLAGIYGCSVDELEKRWIASLTGKATEL